MNCHLVHQICFPHGEINIIVIFRKDGAQAMLEFYRIESGRAGSGCPIYSGCCTRRIEQAKPARLNVHKNDDDSFDYVTPSSYHFTDVGQIGDPNGDGYQQTGSSDQSSDSKLLIVLFIQVRQTRMLVWLWILKRLLVINTI